MYQDISCVYPCHFGRYLAFGPDVEQGVEWQHVIGPLLAVGALGSQQAEMLDSCRLGSLCGLLNIHQVHLAECFSTTSHLQGQSGMPWLCMNCCLHMGSCLTARLEQYQQYMPQWSLPCDGLELPILGSMPFTILATANER